MLQTIGKCIDKKVDTSEYVSKVNSGEIVKEKAVKKASHKEKDKIADVKENSKEKKRVRDGNTSRIKKSGGVETPKSIDKVRESTRTKSKDSKTSKPKQKAEHSKKDSPKSENKKNDSIKAEETERPEDSTNKIAKPDDDLVQNEETNGTNVERKDVTDEAGQLNNGSEENPNSNLNQPIFSNAQQGRAGLSRPKSARPKSGDRMLSAKAKFEPPQQILDSPVEMKSLASGMS